ncbi:transcriptional repressor LexA [Zongyangia hominis]|uniref:LexA repressor n=1 Tax=Zongyangia hominis TaxID=2763677 RepID=A0A926ECM1_9FIRM|nr:transcriptional repressor LexA [Zongyangia hominis]MBC8571363.1 transcriptional repressor LexA [Zongyangia hominis]
MHATIDFEQEILRYLKEHSGDDIPPTVREIAAGVGIRSTSTVHKYLGILEDKGYITKKDGLNRTIKLTDRSGDQRRIPIIGTVTAGSPILAYEEVLGYLPCVRKDLRELYALRVKGESMIKVGILDGDLVIVRRAQTAENGEIVVALIDDEATVKRFYKENGGYRLQPENDTMAPIYTDHVQILGKVISSVRFYEEYLEENML